LKTIAERTRRHNADWEKIFAKNKGLRKLLSKIHDELLKLNSKKANDLIKNKQSPFVPIQGCQKKNKNKKRANF
jgi:hypothetical protein